MLAFSFPTPRALYVHATDAECLYRGAVMYACKAGRTELLDPPVPSCTHELLEMLELLIPTTMYNCMRSCFWCDRRFFIALFLTVVIAVAHRHLTTQPYINTAISASWVEDKPFFTSLLLCVLTKPLLSCRKLRRLTRASGRS